MYYAHHVNPLGVLVGLVVIFVAILILGAAMRQFGQGSCLEACCLWELGNSIMDMGCGLIGCGGVLAVLVLPLLACLSWFHN